MSLNPTLAAQSFASLSTYIVEQLPFATAQLRAHNVNIKAQSEDVNLATLRADLACAQATIAAMSISAFKKPKAPAKRGRVAPPTAQDIAKWTPGRTYCWTHGYVKHNVSTCSILEPDAQWKREATSRVQDPFMDDMAAAI